MDPGRGIIARLGPIIVLLGRNAAAEIQARHSTISSDSLVTASPIN
jgi:hypothetical protein